MTTVGLVVEAAAMVHAEIERLSPITNNPKAIDGLSTDVLLT
jgi:hypothetical protein